MKLSGHEKRVTLNLGRCAAVCLEMPNLAGVLAKLPGLDFDLEALDQRDIEVIYAEFDKCLENKIRDEFIADPAYLIDLGIPDGVCPLCGHKGCRFIFRLENQAGGENIECGSECIRKYGLSVKGAETAEEARKLLEKAIRVQIKKVKLEAWHKKYEFKAEYVSWMDDLFAALTVEFSGASVQRRYWVRVTRRLMSKLSTFYDKHGWFTEKRWEDWRRVYKCVVVNKGFIGLDPFVPQPKPWSKKEAVPAAPPTRIPVSLTAGQMTFDFGQTFVGGDHG